jgi:hypothetical protein
MQSTIAFPQRGTRRELRDLPGLRQLGIDISSVLELEGQVHPICFFIRIYKRLFRRWPKALLSQFITGIDS